MKILVCISHVPDTTARIAFTNENTEFDKSDIQFIISPYEELALTRALEIKETLTDVTISVVTVGEKDVEPTLRKALAIGADDAFRIDAKPIDGNYVARQISDFISKNDFKLVLAGKESIDYNGSQVGEMIGAFCEMPTISAVSHVDVEDNMLIAMREISSGREKVKLRLPAVVACQKGIAFEPRIPSMRGIMMSRRKPLNVIDAVEAESLSNLLVHHMPEEKKACKMFKPGEEELLVDALQNEAKVL